MAGRGAHGSNAARGTARLILLVAGTPRVADARDDLTAEFEPWDPPPRFDENTYVFPNRMFNKAELLGYVDYCRGKVRQTLDALTEEMAAQPIPSAHRDHGMLFGVIVGSMPLHVAQHASQIRQFLTAAGVKVQPMPGIVGTRGEGNSNRQ